MSNRRIIGKTLVILCACLALLSLPSLVPGSVNALTDLYEPDNTPDTATPIAIDGTEQNHSIYPAGDVDYISFSATSGMSYVIETSNLADGCDTSIYLYDTNGKALIEHNDDAGGGVSASMIEWTPKVSDTYYIKVQHYDKLGTGSYDIKVSNYVPDAYEPDDSLGTTINIPNDGTEQNHSIYPAGDVDYISFSATSGINYIIETFNLSDICDTYIYLYDTDVTSIIAEDDDSGEGFASRIVWTPVVSGIYYIEVSHYDITGIGSYDVMVRSITLDVYEPDGIPDTASEISTDGTVQSHSLDPPWDIDYISFTAISGVTYVIETSNLVNGCDTYIHLYDTDGTTLIDEDNDGGEDLASRIEWTPAVSGTYYIEVSNYNITGFGSYDINVHYSRPTAGFSAAPVSGDEPLKVNFSDLSASYDDIALWLWDFDNDGTIDDTVQNPTHEYIQEGSYTVSLTLYDIDGDYDTAITVINVTDIAPSAAFTATPTSGDEPLVVNFTDTSVSNDPITSWLWDFGDGQTSSEQNPSHEYAQDNIYNVTLTVTDSNDNSDTEIKTNYVTVNDTVPTADFSATLFPGSEPRTLNFVDLSMSYDGSIVSWYWDFGDSQASAGEQNPIYTYSRDGIYTISLTVTDSDGDSDTATADIYVASTGIYADFSGIPASGDEPLTVNFTDRSISYDSTIISWLWDFGDGQISSEQNPVHEYTQDGVYSVSLTVNDTSGSGVETKTGYITVYDTDPSSSFVVTPASGDEPLVVNFTDTSVSNDPITSWLWDFGDGQTSSQQSPNHEYAQDGVYSAALTVTDSDGDSNTASVVIIVTDTLPVAAFTATPTSGGEPLLVSFTDTSTSDDIIAFWLWDFGDGKKSTEQNPDHEYTQDGTYTALLTIYDIDGDSDTATLVINVTDTVPAAAFTAKPAFSDEPLVISFTDISVAHDKIISWLWDFGDGQTSSEQNPIHEYSQVGVYTISLTVTDADGSSNIETRVDYLVAGIILVQQTVSPDNPATLKSEDDQITIEFPEGSVAGDTMVTVIAESQYVLPPCPSGFKAGDTCFKVDLTEDLEPETRVTITVKYSADDLAACGEDSDKLTLARYDEDDGEWVILETTVDTEAMTLTTEADVVEGSWLVMVDNPASGLSLWVLLAGVSGGLVAILATGGAITIKRRGKTKE